MAEVLAVAALRPLAIRRPSPRDRPRCGADPPHISPPERHANKDQRRTAALRGLYPSTAGSAKGQEARRRQGWGGVGSGREEGAELALELHGVRSKATDAVGELVLGHLVVVEVEAELRLGRDDLGQRALRLGLELSLDVLLDRPQLFEQRRADGQEIAALSEVDINDNGNDSIITATRSDQTNVSSQSEQKGEGEG